MPSTDPFASIATPVTPPPGASADPFASIAQPIQAAPPPTLPPKPEGTYMMTPSANVRVPGTLGAEPAPAQEPIPYSKVHDKLNSGYLFADRKNLTQYARDHAADPLSEDRVDRWLDKHPYLGTPMRGLMGGGTGLLKLATGSGEAAPTRLGQEIQMAADRPTRGAQEAGGQAAEGTAEFMSGEELFSLLGRAGEAMGLAQKLKTVSGIAEGLSKMPPMVQKVLKIGMSSVKAGTIAGAQDYARTGDVSHALNTGAETAVTTGGLGSIMTGAGSLIKSIAPRAVEIAGEMFPALASQVDKEGNLTGVPTEGAPKIAREQQKAAAKVVGNIAREGLAATLGRINASRAALAEAAAPGTLRLGAGEPMEAAAPGYAYSTSGKMSVGAPTPATGTARPIFNFDLPTTPFEETPTGKMAQSAKKVQQPAAFPPKYTTSSAPTRYPEERWIPVTRGTIEGHEEVQPHGNEPHTWFIEGHGPDAEAGAQSYADAAAQAGGKGSKPTLVKGWVKESAIAPKFDDRPGRMGGNEGDPIAVTDARNNFSRVKFMNQTRSAEGSTGADILTDRTPEPSSQVRGGGGVVQTENAQQAQAHLSRLEDMEDSGHFDKLPEDERNRIQAGMKQLREQLGIYYSSPYRASSFAPIDIESALLRTHDFGQAGFESQYAAQPVYNKLDELSEGDFSNFRKQARSANKILRNPESTIEQQEAAQNRLDEANRSIDQLIDRHRGDISDVDYMTAKNAYREGATYNGLHNTLERMANGITLEESQTGLPRVVTGSAKTLESWLAKGNNRANVEQLIGPEGITNLKKMSLLLSKANTARLTGSVFKNVAHELHRASTSGILLGGGIGEWMGLGFGKGAAIGAGIGTTLYTARKVMQLAASSPRLGSMVNYAVTHNISAAQYAPLIARTIVDQYKQQTAGEGGAQEGGPQATPDLDKQLEEMQGGKQ